MQGDPEEDNSDKEQDEDENGDSDDSEGHNVFYKPSELIFRPKSILRNWLRKTGKGAYIEFDEKQMEILSECFKDLDEDGS